MFNTYTEQNVPKVYVARPHYDVNDTNQQYVALRLFEEVPEQPKFIEVQQQPKFTEIQHQPKFIDIQQQPIFVEKNSNWLKIVGVIGGFLLILLLVILALPFVFNVHERPYDRIYSDDQWG